MGLDWNPMAKPRAGFEEEFHTIFHELQGTAVPQKRMGWARIFNPRRLTESEEKERRKRFQEISDPPYALLGAPRVGYDEAADGWLLDKLERAGKRKDYEKARTEMHGYYVLDLLPGCDGFPSYSNYGAYEGLDRYSFRGSFLKEVEDVLGPELTAQAYQAMLPDDLIQYGRKLLEAVRAFARVHGVEHVEREPPADFDEGSAATRADIIFSAAKWCLFWAERGHGLEPWF
jgi:hypothetical protein